MGDLAMEFCILGPLEVRHDGMTVEVRGSRERALLAVLLLHLGRPVSVDQLVVELWGTSASDRAPANLRVHVSRLRKTLAETGEDPLDTRAGGYVLRAPDAALDARRFHAIARAGRNHLTRDEPQQASELLHDALSLWRGPALADVAGPLSVSVAAAELDDSRVSALEDRIEADLACGRHSTLAGELEALTSRYPLRERLWSERILALYRCGRQADALRAYQALRERLAEELGIEPSPAVRDLEHRVLGQDASLDWRLPQTPAPTAGPLPATVCVVRTVMGPTTRAEAAAVTRDQLDILLGDAVAAHGGQVLPVPDTDQWVTVFADPRDGAHAAVSLLRALAVSPGPAGCGIDVRVGMAQGEMAATGRPSGPVVEIARALCGRAEPSRVLCTKAVADALVAGAAGDSEQFALTAAPWGSGLTYELRPTPETDPPLPEAVTAAATLPAGFRSGPPHGLVGRDDELALLRHEWTAAAAGSPRIALVAGEAGVGKTTLAREFALVAHEAGATVLLGRCDEEILMPYQPFAEALREYLSACPHPRLEPEIERRLPELARLVPSLRAPEAVGPTTAGRDAEGERYRLFEAVRGVLQAASEIAPVLLVLEDLHTVDSGSILLLRHLLRGSAPGAIMVLATYRDVEVEPGHPLADALAEFRRAHIGQRMHLGGLRLGDVEQILAMRFGAASGTDRAALAERLWRQTEGNPFFVEEVIQHLIEAGALDEADGRWRTDPGNDDVGIPEGVKEVIGRRLDRLSPACREAMAVGAVVGRTFSCEVIEEIISLEEDTILDALDEAMRARIVIEVPRTVGCYTFTHTLIRETLYDGLSMLRRVRTHRKVGEALERMGDGHAPVGSAGPAGHVAALAYHFFKSAEGGDIDKALSYVVAAAEEALAHLAYEEAVGFYEQGIELLQAAPATPDLQSRRSALLLGLGDAKRRAGNTADSRAAFRMVADLGRSLPDPSLLAQAALGAGLGAGGVTRASLADTELIALLEEALDALGPDPSALRARVMSRLSEELHFTSSFERRFELAETALREAELLGDPSVVLDARYSHQYCLIGPDGAPSAQLAGLGELLALAEELADREIAYQAHLLLELAYLELGEPAAAAEHLAAAAALAEELRIPTLRAWVTSARSRREWEAGNFDEAARLNQQAMDEALSQGGDADIPMLIIGGQAMAQQVLRTPLDGFIEPLREYVGHYPDQPSIRCFLAYAHATLGHDDEATALLRELAGNDFGGLPRGEAWRPAMWALSRTAALVGDAVRARALYELLIPSEDLWLADFANISLGPVATQLGMLAATFGRYEAAERHFAAAVEMSARLPAPPWLADARHEFARMLVARDGPGDRERAKDLLLDAQSALRTLSMPALESDVTTLLAELSPAPF
ncbi:MAG: hypothetical protein NVS1B12_12870 [Acidimicrobiales bacterium]